MDFIKEFQKCIEFDQNAIHLNVKENQHATQPCGLVEKQKDFSIQKINVFVHSLKKVWVRMAGVVGSKDFMQKTSRVWRLLSWK